jgi:hypothetical protein
MNVVIDGIKYVPEYTIPPLDDVRLERCIQELLSIQRFPEYTNKHRAWAWDALNAIAPDIAKLPPEKVWNLFFGDDE